MLHRSEWLRTLALGSNPSRLSAIDAQIASLFGGARRLLLAFSLFPLLDRAAGFPSPRPQATAAGAHRACQGWPLFRGIRRLGLDTTEHAGTLVRSGALLRRAPEMHWVLRDRETWLIDIGLSCSSGDVHVLFLTLRQPLQHDPLAAVGIYDTRDRLECLTNRIEIPALLVWHRGQCRLIRR